MQKPGPTELEYRTVTLGYRTVTGKPLRVKLLLLVTVVAGSVTGRDAAILGAYLYAAVLGAYAAPGPPAGYEADRRDGIVLHQSCRERSGSRPSRTSAARGAWPDIELGTAPSLILLYICARVCPLSLRFAFSLSSL